MFTYLTYTSNPFEIQGGTNRIMYYSTKKSYNEEMKVIYTNFIKALLHNKLNLDKDRFKKQEDIISYLEKYQGEKLFNRNQISRLKNQGEFERVPLTPQSKDFINYVKREFPEFDEFEFVLIKPIKNTKAASAKATTTSKVRASEAKAATVVESINVEPLASHKESIVNEATPTVTTVTETAPIAVQGKETITETITKIVEPVVTETIVKIVEPVAKVVDPVVKVVENVANIPNIIINNANNANAEATTVTSNTQHASSGLDNLLNLFGLKSIAKILKDIFGFDGDGIIYFLIQLPYLI
jgi:hypothetical protein